MTDDELEELRYETHVDMSPERKINLNTKLGKPSRVLFDEEYWYIEDTKGELPLRVIRSVPMYDKLFQTTVYLEVPHKKYVGTAKANRHFTIFYTWLNKEIGVTFLQV